MILLPDYLVKIHELLDIAVQDGECVLIYQFPVTDHITGSPPIHHGYKVRPSPLNMLSTN